MVRVEDVAELSGGDPAIRHRLAMLDLEEFSQPATALEINAEMVRYRALLAGIAESKFHIAPKSSTVAQHWQATTINELIEQSLIEQIENNYSILRDDFELKLVSTLDAMVLRGGLDVATLVVTARLPSEVPIGQRNIVVTISDRQGKSLNLNAVCQMTVYRELAMVNSVVAKGQELNESNVSRVRRPVSNANVSFAAYEQALGKVAQADMQPFSLVNQSAIRNTPPVARNQPDVRRNSLINVVVRQGNLMVTLKNARANENGRIGETIALINPVSNKIIYAKLVDPGTAIIEQ
jgi:flagella basal body P-ring formation protein FlgA